jgi:hypothetical protein
MAANQQLPSVCRCWKHGELYVLELLGAVFSVQFRVIGTFCKTRSAAAGVKTRTQMTWFSPRHADQLKTFKQFTISSSASQTTKIHILKYIKPIFVRVG